MRTTTVLKTVVGIQNESHSFAVFRKLQQPTGLLGCKNAVNHRITDVLKGNNHDAGKQKGGMDEVTLMIGIHRWVMQGRQPTEIGGMPI
jgi:hypothetical protein